jgi:hypothetical protein
MKPRRNAIKFPTSQPQQKARAFFQRLSNLLRYPYTPATPTLGTKPAQGLGGIQSCLQLSLGTEVLEGKGSG